MRTKNISTNTKKNNSNLLTIAILGVVITLSVALVLTSAVAEVDARSSLNVIQEQPSKCRGDAVCTNTGTITITGSMGGSTPSGNGNSD